MKNTKTLNPTLGAVIAVAFWLASTAVAVAAEKATEEYDFDVSSDVRVSLENINGDIHVSSGSAGKVKVVAHKKAGNQEYLDGIKIEIEADEDYVRIETRHPKSKSWFNWGGDSSGSVTYELTVPAGAELDGVGSVNGDVTIEGVAGDVKVETVNGSVDASGLGGNAKLETVNGGIEARFETLQGDQRISADAVNGKIVLVLPKNANARVSAETINGSIRADDFGLEVEKGFVGRSLDGEIGAGEGRISVDTVNGSITLKAR